MEYEFTLKFTLPEYYSDIDSVVEILGENGCDDAIIGIGVPGRIALTFTRKAQSARLALASALKDVKAAIPNSKLIEASPDLVGISDVADYVGFSRQYIRKVMQDNPRTFPEPIHSGSYGIWHLVNVLQWLSYNNDNFSKRVNLTLVETSIEAMRLNLIKERVKIYRQEQISFDAVVTEFENDQHQLKPIWQMESDRRFFSF